MSVAEPGHELTATERDRDGAARRSASAVGSRSQVWTLSPSWRGVSTSCRFAVATEARGAPDWARQQLRHVHRTSRSTSLVRPK
jgi:hypothetical protein